MGSNTQSYLYNTFGLRAVRTSPGTRFYIFNGDQLLGEVSTETTPEVAYTWGPDGLISRRTLQGTAASRWYHFGPQGETRELTNSSGTVTDTYRFDAYGRTLASTGSSFNPYRYKGKWGYYTEGNSNLILATHRWYSPDLMRWVTRDPIEYDGGENLYEYVVGNPIKYSDRLGLGPEDWWDARYTPERAVEIARALRRLWRRYQDMRQDPNKRRGIDKYYHCLAHCEASSLGNAGRGTSIFVGEGREIYDEYIKGTPREECDADRDANDRGRRSVGRCMSECMSYRR